MDCGLSQQAVAEAMGTTQSALSRAEHVGNPTQDFLQRYDEALRKLMRSDSVVDVTTVKFIIKRIAREYGLAEVYLYGSVARGEADADSDVDLLYVTAQGVRLDMMRMAGLKGDLERAFGREVSLTSLDALRRNAKISRASRRFYTHIQPDMIRVA